LGIDQTRLSAFQKAAADIGVPLAGSPFRRGTVACTGSEFCKLALVETKRFSVGLIAELERRMPAFDRLIKLHVTGCPNACGQHWIADIGLQGVRIVEDGVEVDGFDVFIGGGLGRDASVARRMGVRVTATRAPEALERVFRLYIDERVGDEESFRGWVGRVGERTVAGAIEGATPSPT
jgi:sulfite reductase (ferredoxin)